MGQQRAERESSTRAAALAHPRRSVRRGTPARGDRVRQRRPDPALTRLTRNKGDESAPAWSPDGSRILFTSDRNLPEGDSSEVYSVAADGSCLTWLTNGTPASGPATWRPGSGDRYDPGSCDPGSRIARLETPTPPPVRGGLWIGTSYKGLLLSRVEDRFLSYRFSSCTRKRG